MVRPLTPCVVSSLLTPHTLTSKPCGVCPVTPRLGRWLTYPGMGEHERSRCGRVVAVASSLYKVYIHTSPAPHTAHRSSTTTSQPLGQRGINTSPALHMRRPGLHDCRLQTTTKMETRMASADAGVSAASTEQKAWFDYYVRQGESTERVFSKFQAWYGYSVAIACWTQTVSGLGCAESEGGDKAGILNALLPDAAHDAQESVDDRTVLSERLQPQPRHN